MDKTEELYQSAVSLPPVERARLVERILSSFGNPEREEIDRLWAAEAEARIDAYEQGEVGARPAEDVFRDIEKTQ
jgi:putative addiction module component (TIGR02574 family)